MAETYDLESINYLTRDDIQAVINRVNKAFTDVGLQGEEDCHSFYLQALSKEEVLAFPKVSGLQDVALKGILSVKTLPWVEFRQVFENLNEQVKRYGACFLKIGYEEKETKQSKKGYETVGLKVDQGIFYFIYRANGSKVCADQDYGKSVIQELISCLGLAVTLEEGADFYKLIPTRGELKILRGGLFGKNPSAFHYELDVNEPEKLIAMLQTAYEFLGSGKVFECSWSCLPRLAEDNPYKDDVFSFFDLMRQQDLPADSYDLDLQLQVKELADLDVLQTLCRDRDQMYTRLVSFDIDEDDYGELTVQTTKQGHKLQLSMRIAENVEQVAQALGVAFKEV
jgi:hypothetical protein